MHSRSALAPASFGLGPAFLGPCFFARSLCWLLCAFPRLLGSLFAPRGLAAPFSRAAPLLSGVPRFGPSASRRFSFCPFSPPSAGLPCACCFALALAVFGSVFAPSSWPLACLRLLRVFRSHRGLERPLSPEVLTRGVRVPFLWSRVKARTRIVTKARTNALACRCASSTRLVAVCREPKKAGARAGSLGVPRSLAPKLLGLSQA